MSGCDCDIAIVGGGLSGGLIALALAWHRPDVSVRLIEAGPHPGGNHRWSWFSTDLDPAGTALMQRFRTTEWEDGYDVLFPGHRRRLATPYRSLSSEDFAATLERELSPGTLMAGKEVGGLAKGGVMLRDGTRIAARTVIDARGFATTGDLTGGWQVFMGRHLRTARPHGVARPIIMDAAVEQLGGYRFVYVLPLGEDELFIEDTYYQDTPMLDRSALSARIDSYARERGWEGESLGFETGVLPVITGGNFGAFQQAQQIPGVAVVGGRAGLVHPLTSYTLPFAVATALSIAEDADLPGEQLAARLEARARRHWKRTAFYRHLGRMVFGAAQPTERFRIFERFYRLPQPLIERFYAANSHVLDKLRILVGRPPVPVWRALGALATRPPSLLDPDRKEHA